MLTFTNMQRTRVCTTRHAGAATVYLLVCGLASACSGPGADNPRPRPVAAPAVVPAVQAATVSATAGEKTRAAASGDVLDVAAYAPAARTRAAAQPGVDGAVMERELGTASDGGYHAYPSY
jgi:hypothetical protein